MYKFFILMKSNLYFFLVKKNIRLCLWTIFNDMGKAEAKIVPIWLNYVKISGS